MPATSASQTGEKKTMSAVHAQATHLPPISASGEPNKVRTRSSADPPAQAKQPSKYIEARKFLNTSQILPEGAPCTPRTVVNTLNLLAETYKMLDNIVKAMTHISEVAQQINTQCKGCANAQTVTGLIKEMQEALSKDIVQKLSTLESKLTTPPPSKHLKTMTKEIGQAVQSIKEVARKMGKSIVQVTDTNSQLVNTATTFKDTLLKSNTQQPQHKHQHPQDRQIQADLKVLRDINRKARQILIDTRDDKLLNASLAKVKEKVCTAINTITNPPPPQGSNSAGDQQAQKRRIHNTLQGERDH
jgi:hypothetical protein